MKKSLFSKEVKIGLAFVCALAFLIWGINFLKGVNLFTPSNHYYLKYERIDGLVISNGVFIKGYKVGQVKVNGATTQVVVNGIYCFEVKDTAQTTEVEFISESEELVTDATVIFEQPQNGTLKVTYLDFNNGGAAAPQTELQSGDKFAVDKTSYWLCFAVTANEGYELDKILVNGQEASNYGAWLYSIKAAGEYTLTKYVSEKKEVKAKGEIIDEFYKVTLTKVFTDIKEPDSVASVIYEVE